MSVLSSVNDFVQSHPWEFSCFFGLCHETSLWSILVFAGIYCKSATTSEDLWQLLNYLNTWKIYGLLNTTFISFSNCYVSYSFFILYLFLYFVFNMCVCVFVCVRVFKSESSNWRRIFDIWNDPILCLKITNQTNHLHHLDFSSFQMDRNVRNSLQSAAHGS